jgi:sigma54-dependent transcription regulator
MQQYSIGHPFVRSFGIETVGTGQVDDQGLFTGTQVARTGFFIDGYARKIPDFLVKTSQGIKKRAFPTIRIANEANM